MFFGTALLKVAEAAPALWEPPAPGWRQASRCAASWRLVSLVLLGTCPAAGGFGACSQGHREVAGRYKDLQLKLFFLYFPSPDYPLDLNHNDTFLQATTFLPEDFTYFPNHTCPERLPSMSE